VTDAALPDTLFVTLDLPCAGINSEVIEVTYNAALSGPVGSGVGLIYVGTLPVECGANHNLLSGCDSDSLDRLVVVFNCAEGVPTGPVVSVWMGCVDAESDEGINVGVKQPFSLNNLFSCPADISPVDLEVELGAGPTDLGLGLCCEGESAPTGTAHITE
jgi:hypothetical protein